MTKIETRTSVIFLFEKGIIWEDLKSNVEIGVPDIQENILASLTLTNGKRHSAVLDARDKEISITNDAMRYGASKAVSQDRVATAHLTNSIGGKLVGNFFMKFFKPNLHNRMFSDEKEAIAWLRSFSV